MADDSFGNLPTLDNIIQPGDAAKKLQQNSSDLNQTGRSIISAGTAASSDLPQLNDTVKLTHQRLGTALDGLMSQVDGARDTISDAYSKIQAGRNVPVGIARILSIFGNHDYDVAYQQGRITAASTNLELSNQSVKTLAEAASSAENSATFARQNLEASFNASSAIAANTRADIQSRIQLQDEQQVLAERQLNNMTEAQLMAAKKNPDLLTKQNPNITSGLIESTLQRKQGARTALETAQAVLQGTTIENKEKNMALINHQITNHLNLLSNEDFQAQAEQAAKTGYYDAGGGVKIPNQMYLALARQREEASIAHAKTTAEFNEAKVGSAVLQPQIEGKYDRIVNDPTISGSVSEQDKTDLKSKYLIAKSLENSGNPTDVLTRYKLLGEINSQIEKFAADSVAAAPKEAQPGRKQFYASGTITDPEAANGVLIGSTLNSSSPFNIDKLSQFGVGKSQFNQADPYAAGDQILRTNLLRLRDQANYPLASIIGSTGTATGSRLSGITNQKPSDSDLFNKALNAPTTVTDPQTGKDVQTTVGQNVKAITLKQMQEIALHNAIMHLGTDFADRPGLAGFKGLISGGEIAPQYRDPTGHLDAQKIFSILSQQDLVDPTKASKNIETLIGTLNDPDFRRGFSKFEVGLNNTPEHAAYRQLLFHNNVATEAISPLVQRLRDIQKITFLNKDTGQLTNISPEQQDALKNADRTRLLSQMGTAGLFVNPSGQGQVADFLKPNINRLPFKRPGETAAQADARLRGELDKQRASR